MKFIFNILFFSFLFYSCENNPDTWINNTIKSEKDVLMATSIDLKKLISKSNLGNIDFLTSDQKLIYSVFKSSFNSSLLGFNIDLPQKLFVINEPGKINGAIFLAGNIEDFKTFKQNLSSFFGVDKFTSSNPTICFSSEYNISFGFNESNFLAAFSLDKNFSEAKISDYFKQENTNKDNEYISEFINLKDDFSFYISYSKINRLINNLNNDFIKSQINSRVNINEFSEDVILSLNFLEGKINCKLKSNPKFYNNFSNGILNKNFKSLVPKDDSLFSFVFANIETNNIESYFSKLSKLGFSNIDNNSIINFKELIPLMNGSIMFSLNNSLKSPLDSLDSGYVLKDSNFSRSDFNKKIVEENDNEYWDDFDFEIQSEDKLNSVFKKSPSYVLSFGIKDQEALFRYFKENNLDILKGVCFEIDQNSILFKDNILHISNNFNFFSKFILNSNLVTNTPINDSIFNKPLVGVLDFKSLINSYDFQNESWNRIIKKTLPNDISSILINGDNQSFIFEVIFENKKINSIKILVENILENKIIENYL
jgi:hypothetical protein